MKKKFILLPFVALLSYIILTGYSSGPGSAAGVEGTGVVSAGCSCHNPSPTSSTNVVVQLYDVTGTTQVTNYVAGGSYKIRVTGTQTNGALNLPKFGFQVSAMVGSSTSSNAGVLSAISNSHTASPSGVNIVEHSLPFLPATGSGGAGTTYVVNIPWTAPASVGTGNVTLRSVINAVNLDGGTGTGSDDKWNTGSVVMPELGAITGPTSVCVGASITLGNAITGGTWSTLSPNASVNISTGAVSGTTVGTAAITYTAGGNFVTKVININANPNPTIGGVLSICQGASTTLTNSVGGGVWSSASSNVSVSGAVVTGVGAGNAIITYAIGSCSVTATMTVSPLAANTGSLSVCEGATTLLSNANSGGTWSSSVTANGTVGAGTGLVNGLAAGTTNITYALPTGCNSVSVVTVNAQPAAIAVPPSVCISSSVTATNSLAGGTWSASGAGPGLVTINSSTGVLSGSTIGTTSITYTASGGCFSTAPVSVNPLPSGILGGFSPFCAGSSVTLTSTPAGGTWVSNNTGIATVSATGVTTGVPGAGGATTITYTLPTGCRRQANITVNGLFAVTGTLSLCPGQTSTLASGPAGGTWSGGVAGIATIGSSTGLVTAIAGGTAGVTYTTTAGCQATAIVSVGPVSAITGGGAVCVGSALTLSDATTGGTWASSNTAVGTIGSLSGILSALGTGTTTVTYTTGGGCFATTVVSVNAAPGAVTGAGGGTFCNSTTITASGGSGGTIYFQGTVSGGTSTAVASTSQTVSASGTYYFRVQSTAGCWGPEAAIAVTINPLPAGITGPASVCVGSSITLASVTSGCIWTSTSNATIGSLSGIVTGVTAGTATVSYTATATGCATSTVINVNPIPADYTISAICVGATANLATTPTGGTWSSGNTGVATIGSSTGIVTGAGAGTSNITYTISTGCSLVKVQNVNALPGTLTGSLAVCQGSTTALGSSPAGGTWTSSDVTKATIGSSTGIVSGVLAGTSTVVYTLGTGCSRSGVITVQPLPTSISGSLSVCTGNAFILSSGPAGGTWSSNNTAIVNINASSGAATAGGTGIADITYTSTLGCTTTAAVSVSATPAAITGGGTAICGGGTLSLSTTSTGGTWSASSSAVTVGTGSGLVTGVSTGIAIVSYTLPSGCFSTTVVTVNSSPAAITGTTSICNGSNTTLANAVSGGTWTSGATSFAIVGSSSGIVTGMSPGTANITYTLAGGCNTAITMSVNAVPAAITGTASTCVGTNTTLATTSTGGTWSSANTAIANVGSGTGIVTGVAVNTTTISYAFSTGCFATRIVSVSAAPSAGTISGSSAVCTGLSITLTDAVSGGTWASSNGNATVSGTGVVTGVSTGLVTITYTVNTACGTVFATKDITVTNSAVAGTISGTTNICLGSTGTLTSSITGGSWTSGNTGIATIGSGSGIVSSVATGTANITYTVSSGCGTASTNAVVTVNALPAPSGGTGTVCVAGITTLTNVAGTWASANTSIASVGSSSGIVSGLSAATVNITFTQGSTGCTTVRIVTVNQLPSAISGTMTLCAGTTTTLTDAPTGGTWASGNTSVAIIGSGTGVVTALSAGTANISYILPTGCLRTDILNVNPQPATITGTLSACIGATTTLGNTATGGTWTSGNTAVASIDASTAIVNGLTAGTSVITYTLPTTCRRTAVVTIFPLPAGITGSTTLCAGATTTLANTTSGGTWSSGNTGIATIGSLSGVTTGIAAGVASISYTSVNGCSVATNVTVSATPQAITGVMTLCAGATTTLADVTGGGIWLSGATTIATVNATSGVVTGVAAGTALISYALGSGCQATAIITVSALPTAFTGTATVCAGANTTLSSTPGGGTWTSANTAVATIGTSTGTVLGVTAGTVLMSYTAAISGCVQTGMVTVNPLPSAITGSGTVCIGSGVSLSSTPAGGTWTSGTPANATIGLATGLVTGVAAGTSIITYRLATGCAATTIETVNAIPALAGPASVCAGAAVTLTAAPAGGTWVSGTTANATIGSSTGVVTGVVAGTSAITYTALTGCTRTTTMNVNPLPSAGTITGASAVCVGASITLSDAVSGGIWSAVNGRATVSAAGIVTGVASGQDTIVYTVSTVCGTASVPYIISVNPLATAGSITGSTTVCTGTTTALGNVATGGVWSSANAGIASVGATGIVTGVATGTVLVSYTVTNSCGPVSAAITMNVLAAVDAGSITGPDSVCESDVINLSNTVTGGVWSSSATGTAVVTALGVVTGIHAGSATISYIVTNACSSDTATHTVVVRSVADCNTAVSGQPVAEPTGLKVYPSPNTGSFNVELPDVNQPMTITITDVMGRVVESRNMPQRANTAAFHLSGAVPGNYVIKVNAGNAVYRQQFVIR